MFLRAFSKPIVRDPIEVLESIRATGSIIPGLDEEIEDSMEFEDSSGILSIELFLTLEKTRGENYETLPDIPLPDQFTGVLQPSHHKNSPSLIAESEHIFNKALFDAVNEALDQFRPGGKVGEPMPFEPKTIMPVDYQGLNSCTPILKKVS